MTKHLYERTATELVKIENVGLTFGDKEILRNVNATVTDVTRPGVEQGQVVCFLGPSGIGKTQLSRIIAGLQTPSYGTVSVLQDIAKGEAALRPTRPGVVCMVPQHYPLFDFLTIKDNLRAAGKAGGLTAHEIDLKIHEFNLVFGLNEHLKKWPKEVSGGTRQRVAIARQLMCPGHLIMMDEPFSGLDPVMKARTTELIQRVATLHTYNTIIVVTHDVTEGLSCADEVWLMGLEPTGEEVNAFNGRRPVFRPGARIVEHYDLAALGFAWRPDITHDRAFQEFVTTVKDRFKTLR